jgi:hypothetical protein
MNTFDELIKSKGREYCRALLGTIGWRPQMECSAHSLSTDAFDAGAVTTLAPAYSLA